ncbi:hypothetical protein R5R35_014222 [Gryllus longicercus]|uniref:MADF domain-containing protein n=1 Tax=Gryllus longicercus TaxID=2509291 RepID=A0AAN9VW41_9ORTH
MLFFLSVEVSKTRWKSLRTSYLRHCKLMACRKKESSKCRKWPLADELSFLNPYLVPTDYVGGANGSVSGGVGVGVGGVGGAEEPEPLSEDAWARVYEEAKPQPMEAVAVRLEVEEDEDEDAPASEAPTEVVDDDEEDGEEDEDDDIEEIMEHHPPEEELREVFRPESNEARADSAGSDGSYSSMITLVEPDSVSRTERRPRAAPGAATTNGVGGGGGDGGRGGGPKRNAQALAAAAAVEETRRQRDTTRDFFLYLADTVKTFPPYLQAQVKGKCFDAVNSAELTYMSRKGSATPKR